MSGMTVSEVILYVRDMGAQVAFYRNVMGLPLRWPADEAEAAESFWVEFETGACTLALHGGGEGRLGADAPKVVFGVEDIEATREMLGQRGVETGEVRSPAPGVLVCDGRDPEGNPFSIEQRAH